MCLCEGEELWAGGVHHKHQHKRLGHVPLPVWPQFLFPSNWQRKHNHEMKMFLLFSMIRFVCDFWLTFQELDVQVLSVDGDGVEALRRLHVLLRAASGPAVEQTGLTSSVQTQYQHLCPSLGHGPGLQDTAQLTQGVSYTSSCTETMQYVFIKAVLMSRKKCCIIN